MPVLRNGFTPVTMPSEHNLGMYKASAGASQSIAAQDALCKGVRTITRATAGQDPNQPIFGVCIATYNSAGGPFTFSPTKFIASANFGMATVCTDPNQEYLVRCETSVGLSNIGNNVIIDQSAPNAALGRSGMAVSIPASASINDPFKIVRLWEGENGVGSVGNGVIVVVNRGNFNAATAN